MKVQLRSSAHWFLFVLAFLIAGLTGCALIMQVLLAAVMVSSGGPEETLPVIVALGALFLTSITTTVALFLSGKRIAGRVKNVEELGQ